MTVLSEDFLKNFDDYPLKFGFGDISKFVFQTKYARTKLDGLKETWKEAITRNVEGLFWILNEYKPNQIRLPIQKLWAKEMFTLMYDMRYLPAGRPLRNLGTDLIQVKRLGAFLNNCAFEDINTRSDIADSFRFIIDMSLQGVGVGVNTEIKREIKLYHPKHLESKLITIGDTREGWVEAIGELVRSHLKPNQPKIQFDYSLIRAEGSEIKGVDGVHSGPEPLRQMMENVRNSMLGKSILTSRVIADISNHIGVCVVSGGQRRSALMLLGDNANEEFLELKNYEINPERQSYQWSSNDTQFSSIGDDYSSYEKRLSKGQSLGIIWIGNFKRGRLNDYFDEVDYDQHISGCNPCAEMGLESGELCNLIEVNANNLGEYDREVYFYATLTAKIINLMPTNWEQTNEIKKRNARFGIGQTGVVEYLSKFGIDEYRKELEEYYQLIKTYDRNISKRLDEPRSIRTTTVKPSGSLSLLMGTTAGMHYPTAKYLKRRVRVGKNTPYPELFRKKGYHVEDDVYDKTGNTSVVTFLTSYEGIPSIDEVSMYDQFNLAAFMQKHWADNGVSVTISYDELEIPFIANALEMYQYHLKAVSFLRKEMHEFAQLPEESITNDEFIDEQNRIDLRKIISDNDHDLHHIKLNVPIQQEYCETDHCEIQTFINDATKE